MAELALEQIQGLIFFGYGHLEYAAYLFLHIEQGDAGRRWLEQALPHVISARSPKANAAAHVAFTCAGLRALGLPEDGLGTFPRQFQEGMATDDRARVLGDMADQSPKNWQFGGPDGEEIHVLLMMFARTPEARAELTQRQEAVIAQSGGLHVVWREESERPQNNQEHFGFRDGLSQPAIDGSPVLSKPGETVLAPGEFVLGYPNAYGQIPFAPTVEASSDTAGLLTPDENDTGRLSLGRNGSYLVFRKLQQHVGSFWSYYRAQAEKSKAADSAAEMNRLAAKSVGRWRSGAPLTLSPEEDTGQPVNNFGYRKDDSNGERCPFGAHIRRANPRDMLPPDTTDNSATINHHRILRRGRPYGPCLLHPDMDPDDGTNRGLLFIAVNANIRRQFEFVQQTWITNPGFGGLYTDRDPLLGSDPEATVTLPGLPTRTRLCGLPRFVTMRGGGYFFLPSLPALRYLAGLK